jgi:hypothetical protein
VTVNIDGIPHTLALTLDAMVAIEDLFEAPDKAVTFGQVVDAVEAGSVKHLRAMIWALLQRHHPTVTLGDVSSLVERAGGVSVFTEKLSELSSRMAAKPKPSRKATRK